MKNELDIFVENILKESKKNSSPMIISVSGGSCTGKSTLVDKLLDVFGGEAQVIHQDDYQLGSHFTKRKESKYKWDDPENFQINKSFEDLKTLVQTGSVSIPMFNLRENEPAGVKYINVKKVNIFEGIYSALSPLNTLTPFSLYIEAPYYLRFLRRIQRFISTNQDTDFSTPLRHMATFVLKAHQDYVVEQKKNATLIIKDAENVPFFHEIKDRGQAIPLGTKLKTFFKNKFFSIMLYEYSEKYIGITQNDKFVYFEKATEEVVESLENVDWMSY